MKKTFYLFILFLLTLSSCNEKITCTIISPAADEEFSIYEPIYINVEASTNKGSILQVQIFLGDSIKKSFVVPPYKDTIPPQFLSPGFHDITAAAYSSEGNTATDALYIKIKESGKNNE